MSFASAEQARSRWGDVYLAAGARGVSTCGDFLAATALALALQSAGAGGLAVSGLMLAAVLPLVVLAPLTGRLADRVDSRTLLVGAGVAQAGICVVLAYAEGTALIIALVALLACGLAVTQPTLSALLPEMVRRDDLPRATALNQTAGSVGVLVGPALAGLLVGEFGTKVPLLIDGASYLALVAAGLLLRTTRNSRNTHKTATVAWRLRRDPMVLAVTAAVAATIAGVGAVSVVEIFFVRETLGGSTTAFGLVQATWTAGMLAGAWLLTRPARRAADDGALVNGLVLMLGLCCLAVLAGAAVPAVGWLVPLWLAGGVLNGGLNVFLAMVMARRVPAEARGRAFAVQGAAIQGAGMFGYLAGGLLLESFAPRPLVAACGLAGLVVVALVAIPVTRAVRGERKAPRAAWATSAASA
ncbi:MFS transporter [Phytohabitans sp. LJ34]|uniref:MFS transporter n=1 Tax=Phytohabitans sp. LJ34 TaxID=3452217 RepID=UPI003F89D38E